MSDFNEIKISYDRIFFLNSQVPSFIKFRPVGPRVVPQTNMTTVIAPFRNYANAPKSRTHISGNSNVNDVNTYLITGTGLPPVLEHVSSVVFPSVDMGLTPGKICGGPGGVRTVRAKAW